MKLFTFKNLFIIASFIFLIELFSVLFVYNSNLRTRVNTLTLVHNAQLITPTPFPILKTVLGSQNSQTVATGSAAIDPLAHMTAYAAVVMDRDSKAILYEKNSNIRFSMASTVKVMTALTALEYFLQDDVLTVQTQGVEGVNVGFSKGQKVRFMDLLYAMLLPSGNDAALAIAQNFPGGERAFVGKMNQKAQEYRLLNTHFEDPIGLTDDGDYTTPVDLARLADIALKNSTFSSIVRTKSITIHTLDGTEFVLNNLNKLLGYSGVDGVKTGFTSGAGGVLVTSKNENGKSIIVVIMKSTDRFFDTRILLDYISDNIEYVTF